MGVVRTAQGPSNRAKPKADFLDPETGVKIEPIFLETGESALGPPRLMKDEGK